MTRRADPERIYAAQRAGTVARIADQIGLARAVALVEGWEAEAQVRGIDRRSPGFWTGAERWFTEQSDL